MQLPSATGLTGLIEPALALMVCFALLSLLCWAMDTSGDRPAHPLLAYPPQRPDGVLVHCIGLGVGALDLLQ